jgi:hypothetical protein
MIMFHTFRDCQICFSIFCGFVFHLSFASPIDGGEDSLYDPLGGVGFWKLAGGGD